MEDFLQEIMTAKFVVSALTAIAVVATMISLTTPFLGNDQLAKRMKEVSSERERIRKRERAQLSQQSKTLRAQPI